MKNCLCIILFSVLPIIASAQTDLVKLSIDLGIAQNYQPDSDDKKTYTISPEIKLGGAFISNQFEWDAGLSYWWDGIRKEIKATDIETYSYSNLSLGLRLNYLPKERIIPIHFISGLSARLVRENYIGGEDYGGNYRNDNVFMLYTLDIGAGIDVKISDNVKIRADGIFFIPVIKKELLDSGGSGSSFKIGFDYYFPKKN